jgi:outer membrane protein TolC
MPASEALRLAPPGDEFPPPPRDGLAAACASDLKEPALRRRGDLLAAQHSCRAWKLLTEGARNARRPGLDATLGIGYIGRNADGSWDKAFSAFGQNTEGANARLALEFDYPLRNRAALGRFRQAALERDLRLIERDDLERRICYAIDIDIEELRARRKELVAFIDAEALYAKAFENEREKLQIGMTTPMDLLTAEEQLTVSALTRLDAERACAIAIARLRFDTGALLETSTDRNITVKQENLTTVPVPAGDGVKGGSAP